MKLTIGLDKTSIRNAINNLKKQKKIITDYVIPEFMEISADWIINRANEILDRSDIGEIVKTNIFNGWGTEWVGKNHLKIINSSWKAAFVEFGVGVVAESASNAHPNAANTNWQYNVDTGKKYGDGRWFFSVENEEKLDIPKDAIIEQITGYDGDIGIETRGTKGVWYLFNAVEDFKLYKKKELWEKTLKKYWG